MKRRNRANGEGTIWKTGGKWRVQISCGSKANGKRRRITRTVRTHAEAVALLHSLRALAGRGATGELTLAAFLESWVTRLTVSPNTLRSYSDRANAAIAGIGHIRLSKLTAAHIEDFVESVNGGRTKQHTHAVLRLALNDAVRRGEMSANPAVAAARPKHTREEPRPFTADEASRIMEHCKDAPHYAVIVLAFTIGARQGEMFGLKWSDIDLNAGTLRIERQARNVGGKVTLAEPKTQAAKRTVNLTPLAIDALTDHRKLTVALGHAANPLVFPAMMGGLTDRNKFRQRIWNSLLVELKIEHRGFHHARHTFATLALGSGVPVTLVSGILGHTNAATTLRAYARWIPTDQGKVTEAMQRLFARRG